MHATVGQHFPEIVIVITDKDGKPAPIQGVPGWTSSDQKVLQVAPNAGGMGGTAEAVGPGTARITVSANADLRGGTSIIVGVSEDIVVTAGMPLAQGIRVDIGNATAKV